MALLAGALPVGVLTLFVVDAAGSGTTTVTESVLGRTWPDTPAGKGACDRRASLLPAPPGAALGVCVLRGVGPDVSDGGCAVDARVEVDAGGVLL
jgi:hypothetical protein